MKNTFVLALRASSAPRRGSHKCGADFPTAHAVGYDLSPVG